MVILVPLIPAVLPTVHSLKELYAGSHTHTTHTTHTHTPTSSHYRVHVLSPSQICCNDQCQFRGNETECRAVTECGTSVNCTYPITIQSLHMPFNIIISVDFLDLILLVARLPHVVPLMRGMELALCAITT